MRLVRPEALGLLLLAAPVLWAWLRRPPVPTRVVSSLLLLRALPGVGRRRRRIVDVIGLLLLLGVLIAGVLGLALETGPAPVPWIAVVDEGPGMQAVTDDGRTRADRARAALVAELAARPGAPVTLVGTAPPRVLAWAETHPDRALAVLAPADSGLHDDPGRLLAGLCADGGVLRWFGDDPPPEVGCDAARVDLGMVENRGLVSVTARQVDRLGTVQVQARSIGEGPVLVRSGTSEPVALDGSEALVALAGSGTVDVALLGPDGAADGDGLAGDDAVRLELPPTPRLRVALITERPRGFVATALATHPGLSVLVAAPNDPVLAPLDLLVVETPPAGPWPSAPRVVLLGVEAPGLGVTLGRTVPAGVLQPVLPDEPLLAHMHLVGLRVPRARAVPVLAGGRAVVHAGGVPLVSEGPFDGGRLVALGFDPAASELPLRVDFVHLIANLVQWADPTPGAVAVASLPGASETAPAASPSIPAATPHGPRLTWWVGALLGLGLLLTESARALRTRTRPT